MTTEWIYPARPYQTPEPAKPGFRLEVQYDCFLGLEVRWRYLKEPNDG